MKKSELFNKILKKYPLATEVTINYNGSGDGFDTFDDAEINGVADTQDVYNDIETELFDILEQSDANFNNEGSRGTITISVEDYHVYVDNYYYTMNEDYSGRTDIQFEDEEPTEINEE